MYVCVCVHVCVWLCVWFVCGCRRQGGERDREKGGRGERETGDLILVQCVLCVYWLRVCHVLREIQYVIARSLSLSLSLSLSTYVHTCMHIYICMYVCIQNPTAEEDGHGRTPKP